MEIINHERYVSLEVAKLLKQAGFDWKQYSFYNSKGIFINGTFAANWNDKIWYIDGGKISAPTLDVAQRWLREVKNCQVEIMYTYNKYAINMGKHVVIYTVQDRIHGSLVDEESERPIKLFEVYEKAQEAGIKKCLEVLLEEE